MLSLTKENTNKKMTYSFIISLVLTTIATLNLANLIETQSNIKKSLLTTSIFSRFFITFESKIESQEQSILLKILELVIFLKLASYNSIRIKIIKLDISM